MKTKIWGIGLLILGLVLCGYGIWQLTQPARFGSTTRIKFYYEILGDEKPFDDGTKPTDDAEIAKAEFEIIESIPVLEKVVGSLNLNVEFGEEYRNGETLTTDESISLLRSHMWLHRLPHSKLVEIHVSDEEPTRAARLANAIAFSYDDKKDAEELGRALQGIKDLEKELRETDVKIETKQRELIESQNSTTRKELDDLIASRKSVSQKLEMEKLEFSIPKHGLVRVIDTAQPSTIPISPNRPQAVALLLGGLGLIGISIFLLRFKPHPNS